MVGNFREKTAHKQRLLFILKRLKEALRDPCCYWLRASDLEALAKTEGKMSRATYFNCIKKLKKLEYIVCEDNRYWISLNGGLVGIPLLEKEIAGKAYWLENVKEKIPTAPKKPKPAPKYEIEYVKVKVKLGKKLEKEDLIRYSNSYQKGE